MRETGFGIRDAGYKMQDEGFRIGVKKSIA
jgi:hypothetical protein